MKDFFGYFNPLPLGEWLWDQLTGEDEESGGDDDVITNACEYKEHKKNARPSTKSKHEKGKTRKGNDKKGGEKRDVRRPYSR